MNHCFIQTLVKVSTTGNSLPPQNRLSNKGSRLKVGTPTTLFVSGEFSNVSKVKEIATNRPENTNTVTTSLPLFPLEFIGYMSHPSIAGTCKSIRQFLA